MSTNHYEALSSSGEDELVIDESKSTTEVPPKPKRLTKRKKAVVLSEEEDEGKPLPLPPKKKSYTKTASPVSKAVTTPSSSTLPSESQKWQEAMECAKTFLVPLKVDLKNFTMLFDANTFECFKKACQAWLNEKGIVPTLTFSTHKSFVTLMARFVFDFTLKYCHLEGKGNVNVCGSAIWEHRCLGEGSLKCLHGSAMIQKEQVIEMDVTSENGQRALKEQPQKAKVVKNKWGRNVVQLKNSEALACVFDANTNSGSFSSKSCGLFYSEGSKAVTAFEQIMAYQKACYPKMPQAGSRLLMVLKCDCNYLQVGTPILGRQLCKMTPFILNAPTGIDEECVSDPAVLASIRYPAILVFQCCNPVYRASKTSNQKNCDFKISAPDVVGALQLAKQFWNSYFDTPPILTVPEFKWKEQYQYQSSILPSPYEDQDESLF